MSDGQIRITIEGDSDDLGRALRDAARDLNKFDAENRKVQRSTQKEVGATDKAFSGLRGSMRNVNLNATFLRNSMSLIRWPAMITGAGAAAQALNALSAGALAVGGSLAKLAPLAGALPGVYSEAGQAVGVLALAFKDLDKALSSSGKAHDVAMANLTSEARALEHGLRSLRPVMRQLQEDAQKGLFPGLEKGIDSSLKNTDVLHGAIRQTSDVLGELAERAGGKLGSKDWGRDFATITSRNAKNLGIAGDAALHLAEALKDVMVAAGPLTTALSKDVDRLAKRLEEMAQRGRESGSMARSFKEAHDELKLVADIAGNLVSTLYHIFQAGQPTGDSLLVQLDDASQRWEDWSKSLKGQNDLKQWFADAKPEIEAMARLIADIGKAVVDLSKGDTFERLLTKLDEIVPVLEQMVQTTTEAFGPALIDGVGQFAELMGNLAGSSGPLVLFMEAIDKALGLLNTLLEEAPGLRSALVTGLGAASVFKALQIAEAISGMKTLRKLVTGMGAQQAAATAAGSAAAGAGGGAAAAAAKGGGAGLASKVLGGAKIGAGVLAAGYGLHLLASQNDVQPDKSIDKRVKALDAEARKMAEARGGAYAYADALRTLAAREDALANTKALPALHDVADALRTTAAQVSDFRSAIDRLAKTVDPSFDSIRTNARITARGIKQAFGPDTAESKQLLATNFQAAAEAVRASMDAAGQETKAGVALMNKYLREALAQYGITGKEASRYLSGKDTKTGKPLASTTGQGAASGAMFVGKPGDRGRDNVPALLNGQPAVVAKGELVAVLNSHQQTTLDSLAQMGGYGGLQGLMKANSKPHNLASGGLLGGLKPGIRSAVNKVLGKFPGLQVTSTTGGHHAPGSYHYRGLAADIAGAPGMMNAAASWVDSSMGRSLTEGIHNPNLSIKGGKHVPSGFWGAQTWAGHADHIHLAIAGALKAQGFSDAEIKRVLFRKDLGVLSGLGQAGMDGLRAAGMDVLSAAGASSGAEPSAGLSDFTGGGDAAANRALGKRMAAAMGWTGGDWSALDQLWTGESGWKNTAVNPSSGAAGIAQSLGHGKVDLSDAAGQIRWGLNYIKSIYGSPSAALSAWLARNPHWYRAGGLIRAAGGLLSGSKPPKGDWTDPGVVQHPDKKKGGSKKPTTSGPAFPNLSKIKGKPAKHGGKKWQSKYAGWMIPEGDSGVTPGLIPDYGALFDDPISAAQARLTFLGGLFDLTDEQAVVNGAVNQSGMTVDGKFVPGIAQHVGELQQLMAIHTGSADASGTGGIVGLLNRYLASAGGTVAGKLVPARDSFVKRLRLVHHAWNYEHGERDRAIKQIRKLSAGGQTWQQRVADNDARVDALQKWLGRVQGDAVGHDVPDWLKRRQNDARRKISDLQDESRDLRDTKPPPKGKRGSKAEAIRAAKIGHLVAVRDSSARELDALDGSRDTWQTTAGIAGDTQQKIDAYNTALKDHSGVITDLVQSKIPMEQLEVMRIAKEIGDWTGTTAPAGAGGAGDSQLAGLLKQQNETLLKQHAIDQAQFNVFSGFAPLVGQRMIGSYDRGIMDVPADMLAVLHKGETVTPNPNGPYGTSLAPAGGDGVTVELHFADNSGQLVRLIDARVDGRAAKIVSEQSGRRQRLIAGSPGGRR